MIATRPLGLGAQSYSTKAQGFIQQTFALDHTPSSEVQQNFEPSHSSIYPVHHPEHEQTKKINISQSTLQLILYFFTAHATKDLLHSCWEEGCL